MAHVETHAGRAQAMHPRAQQGRGLHVGGKHAPRGADEGFDAEPMDPFAQLIGAEGAQQRRDLRAALAEAAFKAGQRLGVREVQASAPREQELAPDRGHGVVEMHFHAPRAQHFSRHQPGRTAADHGDLHFFFRHSRVTNSPCPVRKAARTVSPG
jgi:hypothetical protein